MTHNKTMLEIHPLDHGFGATVRGLDLRARLDDETAESIRSTWAIHGVLIFPDQSLDHAELEAFTKGLGEFGVDPFIEPMEDHPHILELRREATEKAANFGAAWHSDWSFQPCPPSGTILHAKVVPPVGGDTLYADGHRAWEALSPAMQSMLEGHRAIHSAAFAYGPRGVLAKEPHERTMKIIVSEKAEETEIHPMIRTHPVTGRKSLFINPVYTVGIEGFRPEENFVLLKFLYDHMVKEEFVYRHQWKENMLVLWDNRSTMHFAEGGYDGHLRLMHRTTLAGDRPS
ncbi:MAG: TauD/TfdA family dioxygenase [Myxococcota bacterium]